MSLFLWDFFAADLTVDCTTENALKYHSIKMSLEVSSVEMSPVEKVFGLVEV